MDARSDIDLPLRPAANPPVSQESGDAGTDTQGTNKSVPVSSDTKHNYQTAEHGGSEDSQSCLSNIEDDQESYNETNAYDLDQIKMKLPFQNYSSHPNIKLLPGLDFGIPADAPFASKRNSGLVGNIMFPHKAFDCSPSPDGVFKVSQRIRTVVQLGIRTYRTHSDMEQPRQIWEKVFQDRQGVDKSWAFNASDNKLVIIMQSILDARKAFREKGGNSAKIRPSFLPFLEVLDEYIDIVEPGLNARLSTCISDRMNTYRKNKRTFSQVAEVPLSESKKARIMEEDEDIASQSPEEQIRIWRAKAKELEDKLEFAHNELQNARDAKSHYSMEWVGRIHNFWVAIRPHVNVAMKMKGKPEWDEGQMDDFLRANGLIEVANGAMGMERF